MCEFINIVVGGIKKRYRKGITFLELSEEYKQDYDSNIILAFQNKRLQELFKKIKEDCEVDFITIKDSIGHKTYMRGMILVMMKAIYDEIGAGIIRKVSVEYSIGAGHYCDIDMKASLTEEMIEKVKIRMQEIVQLNLPFEKRSIDTTEAIDLFDQYGMYDKKKLFAYRRGSITNIYRLGNFEDYYYGYMPPSTGMLKYFDLFLYEDGFVLQLPTQKNPTIVPEFIPLTKLFKTLKESNDWSAMLEMDTVGALNETIAKGEMNDLILVQEALQEKKIAEIAEQIKQSGNKKFIMIAGPSSSGKTTFSHRLSIQLRTLGLKPIPIGIDDYFVNREDTPLDEFNNYNYECLQAIDLKKFNEDMLGLLNGETVEVPYFNFTTGKREYKGNYKTLGKDDILVIEGIHGLNDELSNSLPKESKFKIYISALTQINIDEHNRISTTDGRIIRRMIRDARTRGKSGRETIAMWPSVRRGEEENIFPYQEEADVMFNSALIYELAILKPYVEPILFGIDRECEEYIEAKRLLKFLDYFIGVSSEEVPKNSILKEFIGGSCFHV